MSHGAAAGTIGALAVLCALLWDRSFGEPPVRWHPVVWMGRYLGWAGQWVQRNVQPDGARDLSAALRGALAWCLGCVAVALLAMGLERLLTAFGAWVVLGWPALWPLQALLLGVLLKPMLAWRMLRREVQAVERALDPRHGGSLDAGRARLRFLVSRDVRNLPASGVRESAIETLAENLSDSVLAPLFWFAVFGLPGAACYRFANTADAMWGYPGVYQGRNWAWAGKWAARADDVLNWIPARLTALALLLVGGRRGATQAWQWRALRREARRTVSPNSGWPMAAMALLLDIALRKPDVYVLHAEGRLAQADDTARALQLAGRAVLLCAGCAAVTIRW